MYGRQMNLGWSNFILPLFFFLPFFYLDNVRNRIERGSYPAAAVYLQVRRWEPGLGKKNRR